MSVRLQALAGTLGSAITGACCLGFAPFLAGLSAVGAGFLINDLILLPLFAALLAFSVWNLARSRRRHGRKGPLCVGCPAALLAFGGVWLNAALAYAALGALTGAGIWNLVVDRRGSPRRPAVPRDQ